jgi:RNA polymerase subunit RPABC4/transcription elongation factor Spt4
MGKLILGVIFLFIGLLFFMSSVGRRNLNGMEGFYLLSVISFIAGAVLLFKGIKSRNKDNAPQKEKVCRHCKMMIPESVTTCHYCKKSQGWTLAAKLGLGFIVLIAISSMIASWEKSSSKRSTGLPQQGKTVMNQPDEKTIKQNKETLEKLKQNFIFESDEFKGGGWYTHKNQIVDKTYNRTYLRTHVSADGNIYLSSHYYDISSRYHSSDWIFHKKVLVKIGATVLETDEISHFNQERENSSGSIWEVNHYTKNRDNGIIKLIAENYDQEIKVRFVGKYDIDIVLADQDKVAIKESYELSELLKKTK